MKTKNILLAALLIIISSISTVSLAQTRRTLASFDKITVAQGLKVVYKQSSEQIVSVNSINFEILDNVITEVNNGTLEISLKEGHNIKKSDNVIVYVESPSLKEVYTLRGSSFKASEINADSDFKVIQNKGSYVSIGDLKVTNNIDLIVFGKSSLKIKKVSADNLNLAMKGESRSDIKEVHVGDVVNVKSEGNSFASIGGEAPRLNLKSASTDCLNTRNLACNSIDFQGI